MLKNLGCFSFLRALLKCVNFALLLTDFSQLENKSLILFVGRQLQVFGGCWRHLLCCSCRISSMYKRLVRSEAFCEIISFIKAWLFLWFFFNIFAGKLLLFILPIDMLIA